MPSPPCSAKMRLSDQELAALRIALRDVPYQQAFLFGSRTDPRRRGGDVDLLLFSAAPAFQIAHTVSSRYAAQLEAKLDVLVINPGKITPEQEAFLATLTLEPIDDLL
jgi:hypothetical protein